VGIVRTLLTDLRLSGLACAVAEGDWSGTPCEECEFDVHILNLPLTRAILCFALGTANRTVNEGCTFAAFAASASMTPCWNFTSAPSSLVEVLVQRRHQTPLTAFPTDARSFRRCTTSAPCSLALWALGFLWVGQCKCTGLCLRRIALTAPFDYLSFQ